MTSTGNHPSDFHLGQKVRYIPNHADNDPHHKDCEDGVVSQLNRLIHVRFFRGGKLQSTSEACESDNLISNE